MRQRSVQAPRPRAPAPPRRRPPVRPARSRLSASSRRRRRTARARAARRPVPPASAWRHRHMSRNASRAGSRSSFDRARLELLELLVIGGAHLLEQPQRGVRLLLVDLRQREAHVDEDPVARHDVVEQPDVHRPPYTGDLDPGEPVGLVDETNDLPRNREAHTAAPPCRRNGGTYSSVLTVATREATGSANRPS